MPWSYDYISLMTIFGTGFLTGAASGSRSIAADPERKKRIEAAFRRFRADMLRKEAAALDHEENVWDKMF
jgi:hypothetical protein